MTPNATDTRGNYVSQVDIVERPRRHHLRRTAAHQLIIVGDTLSLTPYETAGRQRVIWRCGNAAAPVPGGALMAGGVNHPNIRRPPSNRRYLPTVCRQ